MPTLPLQVNDNGTYSLCTTEMVEPLDFNSVLALVMHHMQNRSHGLPCRLRTIDALSPAIQRKITPAPPHALMTPFAATHSQREQPTLPEASEAEKDYENWLVFDTGDQSAMPVFHAFCGMHGIGQHGVHTNLLFCKTSLLSFTLPDYNAASALHCTAIASNLYSSWLILMTSFPAVCHAVGMGAWYQPHLSR